MIIRPAKIDDLDRVAAFRAEIANEKLDTISERRYTAEQLREQIENSIQKRHCSLLLAVDGDLITGLARINPGERPNYDHAGRLGMLVGKSYRGQGLGSKLLDAAISTATGWPNFSRIELMVAPWNAPAIKLYERAGFVHEGIMRKAASFRGELHDLLLMSLVW